MAYPIGEPPEELWKRARAERAFWDEYYQALLVQHPDQFVTILNGEVIATNPDLEALIRDLVSQGIDPRDAWVRFLAATRRAIAL